MVLIPDFQPGQILCLEHEHTYLYAELIQIAAEKRRAWVRPVVITAYCRLAELNADIDVDITELPNTELPNIELLNHERLAFYDLRQGADLLCPTVLFRAALDAEFIPLLAQLSDSKILLDSDRTTDHLQCFVRHVWQTHPSIF